MEPLNGKRKPIVVAVSGGFDPIHIGHVRLFDRARELGDKLVVSVTEDRHVNKGIGRPYFGVEDRTEALIALDCVLALLLAC